MKSLKITPFSFKRLYFTLIIITLAFAIRAWPLGTLGTRAPWLTFYPAVMVIAIYGGIIFGLIATFLSCIFDIYLWRLVVQQPFLKDSADFLGMYVFVLTCIMISILAEAMRIANVRARLEQEKAQLANQAKSVFLANMSHELRTPLNAVLGYSEMMQKDSGVLEKHKEYLSIINRSGEHLLSLINEILEIAKIESKKIENQKINFNIHNLINDIMNMFTIQANSKNIALNVRGIENIPPFLIIDQTKLKVVLINLLGNAIKFTQSGEINLSLSYMKVKNGLCRLMISVGDTGFGISVDEQKKLFNYFYQTELGKLTKSGTGLGLAISQDYVKLMGGEITVASELGKGSVFSFEIDVEEGEEIGIDKDLTKKVIGFGKQQGEPKILIVEDNFENRFLLKNLLIDVGFIIKEAENGQDAITVFEDWHPDIILMDMRMPVMNGLEATKIIRSIKTDKEVKIIAVSAHIFKNELDEIFNAGCDDYIGKPYKENEIFNIFSKHLGVQFVYEEESNETDPYIKSIDLTDNILSSIPNKLVLKLREAIIELDGNKIVKAIEEIEKENKNIGVALKSIARNKDYTRLLYLTKENCA